MKFWQDYNWNNSREIFVRWKILEVHKVKENNSSEVHCRQYSPCSQLSLKIIKGLESFRVSHFSSFFPPGNTVPKSQKCPEMGPSLPCANHIWYQRGLNILLHTALSLGVTPILASQTVEIYRKIWLNSLLFFLHFSS